MEITTYGNATSPFDAIKQVRAEGTEYWSARDLMEIMGYSAWQKFENPLERAMATAKNQGHENGYHFNRSVKVIKGGRWGSQKVDDLELTRYGAYLVAMNGDPNMPRVAEAQSYFAIQTRVAETSLVKELTGAELVAKALIEANSMLEAKDREIAELKPAATSYKHWNNELEGEMSRRDLCNKLREHYDINEAVLRDHMHQKGDPAKRTKFDDEGRKITWYVPSAKAVDKGWAKQYPSGKFTKYKWTPSYYAELVKRFTPKPERMSIEQDSLFD